jgi:allantoicase
MMPVVYVAGRFRGENAWEIENNVRRAEDVSFEVLKLGASVICPHANTRFFHGSLPDQVFIDATLALLAKSDAIFMMQDWHRSEGARGERRYAFDHHIPIFYDLDDLEGWVRTGQRDQAVVG